MNQELLNIANNRFLWLLAAVPVSIAIVQAILYTRLSRKNANEIGLPEETCKKAFKSGLITAIGPSMGVFIVLVGMMSVIGGPMSWLRLSIIGSAPLEVMHAELGAKVLGVEFGGAAYGIDAMLLSWTLLALGTQGWIWFVLLFAPRLEKIREKVGKKDPKWLSIMSSAAMIAVFGNLSTSRILKGHDIAVSVVSGAVIMIILGKFVTQKHPKIKEYAVGISMIGAMIIASVWKGMF